MQTIVEFWRGAPLLGRASWLRGFPGRWRRQPVPHPAGAGAPRRAEAPAWLAVVVFAAHTPWNLGAEPAVRSPMARQIMLAWVSALFLL
jgi:hypothetical protein